MTIILSQAFLSHVLIPALQYDTIFVLTRVVCLSYSKPYLPLFLVLVLGFWLVMGHNTWLYLQMWTLCALWHGGAVSICLSYACCITSVTKLCNIQEDREISKKKSPWSSSWVSHLNTKTIYREQQPVTAVREAEQGVALVPPAKKQELHPCLLHV